VFIVRVDFTGVDGVLDFPARHLLGGCVCSLWLLSESNPAALTSWTTSR
jgi:hypothetical protein